MAMRALIGQHDHFAALFEHQRSKFRSASRKKNGGENCCRFHNSLPVVIFSSRLNILMLFSFVGLFYYWVPTEMLKEYPTLNTILFQSALIGLIPFAERLGFVTEQLAMHTNDTYGGLLNATFGNASELIFCCFALRNRLYRVVQLSLLGSILSNLLFVLGLSCFVGGLKYQVQTFTKVSGAVSSGMLMLASISLVLPAALKFSGQEDDATDEIYFSRFTAIIMLIMYFAYLELLRWGAEVPGSNVYEGFWGGELRHADAGFHLARSSGRFKVQRSGGRCHRRDLLFSVHSYHHADHVFRIPAVSASNPRWRVRECGSQQQPQQ